MSSIPLAKTDWSAGDKFTAVEANKLGVNANLLLKSLVAGEALTVTVPKPIYIGDGASENVVLENTGTGGDVQNADSATSKFGDYFVIPTTYLSATLTKFRIRMKKTGSPTTNAVCGIYLADASHHPTGSPLATASIAISGISTTMNNYDFNFSLALTPGVEYIAWIGPDGTQNKSNYLSTEKSTTSVDANAGSVFYDGPSTSWAISGDEHTFRIEYTGVKTESGKFYNAKANDTSKLLVVGWLLETAVKNSSYVIQFGSIISGFSGLTINAKYYLKDDGTIGTTAGTNTVMVGIAISATELLFTRA